MKIKSIKILTDQKILKVTTSEKKVYDLEPYNKKGKLKRFDMLCAVAETMLDHKKRGLEFGAPYKHMTKGRKLLEGKAERVYDLWMEYTDIGRYGNDSPFIIKGKTKDQNITPDKHEEICLSIAEAVFRHNKKRYEDAIYWLGDDDGSTEIEFVKEGDPISNDSLRFFLKTDELDIEHLTNMQYFRDTKAKDLFYIHRKENDILKDRLTNNQNVLLIGPPKIGKTRIVFEELRKLKNCHVFSLYQKSLNQIEYLDFSFLLNNKKNQLIWFIDDLNYFIDHDDNLWKIYEKIGDVQIVATVRANEYDPECSQLIKYMERIKISTWNKVEGEKLAHHHGTQFSISRFTGTPGFIVGNFPEMEELYNSMNPRCKWLLRYLKLLFTFLEFVDYDLLQRMYSALQQEQFNQDTFDECLTKLHKTNFIARQGHLLSSWELYMEEMVNDEDYPKFKQDLKKLISHLAHFNYVNALHFLGIYFFNIKNYNNSIDCQKELITNFPTHEHVHLSYLTWGNILRELALKKREGRLFEETFEKYQKSIELKPNFLGAYVNWGAALVEFGELTRSEDLLEEAHKKFQKAVHFNQYEPEIFCNWGLAYLAQGKLTKKAAYFQSAISQFKKATELKKNYSIAYLNWGSALSFLGIFTKSDTKINEGIEKFKLAIRYNPQYYEAHISWGNALEYLANQEDNPHLLKKAIEKYKKAVEINPKKAQGYHLWGHALAKAGEFASKNHEHDTSRTLFNEAGKMYSRAIDLDSRYTDPYLYWGSLLFRHYELNKKNAETIKKLLLVGYSLVILQCRYDFFLFAGGLCSEYFNNIKDNYCITLTSIFTLSLEYLLHNKNLSQSIVNELPQYKGQSLAIDTLINALLDNTPPLDPTPDDDIILQAAKYLANQILEKPKPS